MQAGGFLPEREETAGQLEGEEGEGDEGEGESG